MAKRSSKRSYGKARSAQGRSQKASWQKWLLALTLVPLVGGVVLIIGALSDIIVWSSRADQIAMGCFYILFSFVASNAVQKQWNLAGGWTLIGIAAWVVLNSSDVLLRVVAAALAGIGMALVSREFLKRAGRRPAKSKKGA